MDDLTAAQRKVLEFIRTYTAQHECSPTVREIARQVLDSPNPTAARSHLLALNKKGHIKWRGSGSHRSIQLVSGGKTAALIDCCRNALGLVDELIEKIEAAYDHPQVLVESAKLGRAAIASVLAQYTQGE